jgi:capsular exopolysaccharide synthesis family protein
MQVRYNVNKMSEVSTTQGGNFLVVDHAIVPSAPGRLQTMSQLLLMGLAIAFGMGFGPPVGLDYLDKRARREDDCLRFTTLPFLEGIPINGNAQKNNASNKGKIDYKLVAAGFASDTFDEMYRSLRTKILLHLHGEAHKMLVITSLNAGEGKSLTASNIAIVMAQQKLRTLLIDGDMRKGVQHNSFLLEKKPGLSEILSSPDELTTLPVNSFMQKTHIPNLSLLSCGMPIPNPAECMNSNKFRDLTNMLAEWFDVIVLDTPPLRVAVDAAMLPDAFNHYIIVARAAKTNLEALEKKINDFPGLRQKVLGVVLNGAPVDKNMHNYTYSYYAH